jgi:hypothetical protein
MLYNRLLRVLFYDAFSTPLVKTNGMNFVNHEQERISKGAAIACFNVHGYLGIAEEARI